MGVNKKTLAAQSAQKLEEADRTQRFATVTDQNRERTRAALNAGLGSQAQIRGEYAGAGPARDMSKYQTGLLWGNDRLGTSVAAWRDLKLQGRDPTTMKYDAPSGESWGVGVGAGALVIKPGSSGGTDRDFTVEQTRKNGWIDEQGNPLPVKGSPWKFKKNKKTGEMVAVDKDGDGQPDRRGSFSTYGELADAGKAGAISRTRQWELSGQIVQVEDAFQAMRAAAEAGDFETADAKYDEAMGLVDQYGLNEHFDPTGLKKDATGLKFSTGAKFDPMSDSQGEAAQALGSPTGMLVGGMVNRAGQLQDPNSQASTEFKSMMSAGALQAVESARTNALRSMASEERGAARSMRDMALQSGAGSQAGKQFAVAARMGERFGTQRAGMETQVGAQRAEIFSNTAKAYEQFRTDFAKDATMLASAWVNDQSGVRDSFRAMQMNMAMNWSSNLMGFATNAQNNATRLVLAELGEVETGGWQGAAGGAVGGATAGAAAGPWGALAGGVIGGAAGYFS